MCQLINAVGLKNSKLAYFCVYGISDVAGHAVTDTLRLADLNVDKVGKHIVLFGVTLSGGTRSSLPIVRVGV